MELYVRHVMEDPIEVKVNISNIKVLATRFRSDEIRLFAGNDVWYIRYRTVKDCSVPKPTFELELRNPDTQHGRQVVIMAAVKTTVGETILDSPDICEVEAGSIVKFTASDLVLSCRHMIRLKFRYYTKQIQSLFPRILKQEDPLERYRRLSVDHVFIKLHEISFLCSYF